MTSATVITHRRPQDTAEALESLLRAAREAGVELQFSADESRKHDLEPGDGIVTDRAWADDVDLCVVLGGDGSILTALRRYASLPVPVFAVNFGELGFLATIEPEDVDDGFRRAFAGQFEVLDLPALCLGAKNGGERKAMNDISVHRRPGQRVAQLAYALGDEEIGRVTCDGLVAATPAGSTGYNLANGGPVMAWGVHGFVVSFIAPHSLTARALVVAPGDTLVVKNESRDEPVMLATDGRPVGNLGPDEEIDVRFLTGQGHLAQLPGTTFYERLRNKFGRLAV
ncbi:MAG TPA: NAD(+)/NADH kinase [Solirubrobacteraceae bacterium]|nr:NAD(+)/NADH kinase [Solirubrobacteraceae bacterium]